MAIAQLHHIIGVILRDIAQARVTSDLFSREVSKYYEQDALLRLFPVPRSEIRDVELNLRFIIDNIAIDADRSDESSAKISGALSHYSEMIAGGIVANLKSDEWPTIYDARIAAPEFGTGLRRQIFGFFEEDKRAQTDKYAVDVGRFTEGIIEFVDAAISALSDDSDPGEFEILKAGFTDAVRLEIAERLNEMSDEVEYLSVAEEFMVLVDVSKDTLDGITTDAAISSITMTSAIRNYTWSQVEEEAGKVIRRLVAE